MIRKFFQVALSGTVLLSATAAANDYASDAEIRQYIETLTEMGFPAPKEDQLVHIPPTMEDLEDADIHPELKRVIRRGYDLFTNTQQLRGKNVFNNMNCSSCHLGAGRVPFSAPIWPAAVTLPDYRGKNGHVNNLEERIAGCFAYSMNGKPPAYGSDDMVALATYHTWLASGVEMYPKQSIYGRGFPAPERPGKLSYANGERLFQEQCAVCHQEDGSGLRVDGQTVYPALWGNNSNNWCAGMVRIFTAAGFIKNNMPLGQPHSLSDQQAWDIAYYMNSQERPQDPRYTGEVKETAEKHKNFHQHSMYGKIRESDGKLLGDHDNTGDKPFLKPDNLRPRSFE
ncbi:MAG TPA: cytochrome C [Marinobacter sp.]|nr:cytochrome C [Marinobacter sp.]